MSYRPIKIKKPSNNKVYDSSKVVSIKKGGTRL